MRKTLKSKGGVQDARLLRSGRRDCGPRYKLGLRRADIVESLVQVTQRPREHSGHFPSTITLESGLAGHDVFAPRQIHCIFLTLFEERWPWLSQKQVVTS